MAGSKLKKFSPEEWDCWLNILAHHLAPEPLCEDCPAYHTQRCIEEFGCPVCKCFYNCQDCQGGEPRPLVLRTPSAILVEKCATACLEIHPQDRVDRLIERLFIEGVVKE